MKPACGNQLIEKTLDVFALIRYIDTLSKNI